MSGSIDAHIIKAFSNDRAFAVLSDVHSNLEALEAVLEDIDKQNIRKIICLGDLVGYCASPKEVIDLAIKKFEFCIMGNHDYAVLNENIKGSNYNAVKSFEWTIKKLNGFFTSGKYLDYLAERPYELNNKNFTFTHASPNYKINSKDISESFPYIHNLDEAKEVFDENFWICFVGHTHKPGIFYNNRVLVPKEEEKYSLDQKMIINSGSVGQPRDKDNRACYVIVDEEHNSFSYRRVKYDYAKTGRKIISAGLPEVLATRLAKGE